VVCACIDIGSNTTRLLVAEVTSGRVSSLLQRRVFTRIGRALDAEGEIARAKVEEVAAVVADLAALGARAGAPAPRIVATAAIRGAPNRTAFCAAIAARAGLPVEILTPEAEARLAFLGATRTLGRPLHGLVGVVDVGGGSSEIAVGTLAGGVTWSASFAIGSGGLTDAHLRSDPPGASELQAITEAAAGAFGGARVPEPGCAVAVGGSAASLRRLVGTVLDPDTLGRAMAVLSHEPLEAVARRFDLDPERVRLLPAGILILAAASRCLGQPLHIGRGGLREGVCIELEAESAR
jgi:exopolyphosphatase/guanosine-5'-triphosphate,3'-diphosphate pyrophosphatase